MPRRSTRVALLDAGIELFLQGGYDFAGTTAILTRANAPRGSFYHHFADKRDFAIAVATYYFESHLPLLDRMLSDAAHTPLRRLRRYFEALHDSQRQRAFSGGCVLGVLAQEIGERDKRARKALLALFERWRDRIAVCLRAARDLGELDEGANCGALASFLIDGWEGALLRMKLERSGRPIEAFLATSFDRTLAPRPVTPPRPAHRRGRRRTKGSGSRS